MSEDQGDAGRGQGQDMGGAKATPLVPQDSEFGTSLLTSGVCMCACMCTCVMVWRCDVCM